MSDESEIDLDAAPGRKHCPVWTGCAKPGNLYDDAEVHVNLAWSLKAPIAHVSSEREYLRLRDTTLGG